jgi:hypothetical protein
MGIFVYVYYTTFVKATVVDVDTVMAAITAMPRSDQLEVLSQLSKLLK